MINEIPFYLFQQRNKYLLDQLKQELETFKEMNVYMYHIQEAKKLIDEKSHQSQSYVHICQEAVTNYVQGQSTPAVLSLLMDKNKTIKDR